jgi:hemoglobin/transferrin/lactoferrin receptor protein
MAHTHRAQQSLRLLVVLLAGINAGPVSGQASDVPPKENPPAAEKKSEVKDSSTEVKANTPVVERITVTAERFERPIDLTPQSVTVLDVKEIHNRPLWNVQAIIADAPGISYQRSGGLDGQMVVRGLSSNDSRIVLFIDGDRFRGRPSLEYSFLDPNEIERIEIIRGPAAALYGADAMNGVVNVITRRAMGDTSQSFSLRPSAYSLGFSSANLLGAGRLELQGVGNGFDMLIGANYRKGENYRSAVGEVPNSDFTSRSLNIRTGYSPSPTRRFELIGKIAKEISGKASAPGAPLVITRMVPLNERSLRLGFTQNQTTTWLQDIAASAYVRNMNTVIRSDTRTAANGNEELRDTWVFGPLELGGKLLARSIISNSVLSYGVDVYDENVPPFEDEVHLLNRAGTLISFSPRAKRVRSARQSNAGTFAHYDWDPSVRLTVSLGTRYDWLRTKIGATPALGESPSLSAAFARNLVARDNALTWSAGMILRPIPTLHFVGNVSTAFRTPTTFDKGGSGIIGALNSLPNADLKPESSVTYEAGVRVRLQTLNANFTAYRSDYKDLLQFVFLDPLTRQRRNIGRAKIDGIEVDGTYAITQALGLRFNAANVHATNTITGVPLPYVPPLNGLAALRNTWVNGSWVEFTARSSRDKTRIDKTQERPVAGYEVYGLYGGVDLGRFQPRLKSYRLTVGVENLTDKAYRNPVSKELIGFPSTFTNPLLEPGRSLTVNLSAGF